MRPPVPGVLVALILLTSGLAGAQPPRLELRGKDQNDQKIEQSSYAGRPLLLLWGDRKGSEFMLAWNRALAATDSDAAIDSALARLDVAHVRGAPFFVKGRIKKRFRRDWDEPVLMDWKGRLQENYGCAEDSCTVLLFDAEGQLQRRWTVGAVADSTLAGIRRAAGAVAAPGR